MPTSSIGIPTITEPIDPKCFADSMTARIKHLNPDFYCGGEIKQGFIQYGSAYNHCIYLNSIGKYTQIVIPAATGSGKTVSSELYLSKIATIEMSGLLVVSEVTVAIEAAKKINGLTGEKVAGVFYSISDKNPRHELRHSIDDLPQIVIITHAMFISRSDSEKDIENLRAYNCKQRDVVIIDERIDLIKRVSFGTAEVVEAVTILRRDEKLHGCAEILSDFNKDILITQTNVTNRNIGDLKDMHHAIGGILKRLLQSLSAGDYNLLKQLRGKKRKPGADRDDVIDLLNRILYVISGNYSHTHEGPRVVCHREENLSGKFGAAIVLDATSQVNPEYDYRDINNHNIKMLNRITSRNYSNVNLNVYSLPGPKQSKTAIYTEPDRKNKLKDTILAYLEVIATIIEPNDKLLVVTYKDVAPIFASHNPYKDQVRFIHWGSKDARGSNAFKDYNKAMVIGWYRRPSHYYVASVMAINQIDSYIPTTGSVWSDSVHLQNMLIVDDMVQFFNRVRCRTAIDNNGNCPSVELYCFTGGNQKMEAIIKASIEDEMPGIIIRNWELKELKALKPKVTKDEERVELFITWLRGKIGKYEEISLAELRQAFSLSRYSVSVVINSSLFKDLLEEEGITMINAKGKGNPVRFIFPMDKV